MIRMTHPMHGVTHAVGSEVEWNIKIGWKVEPEPAQKTVVAATPENVADVAIPPESLTDEPAATREEMDVYAQYVEKFGKQPDGRWSVRRIESELRG